MSLKGNFLEKELMLLKSVVAPLVTEDFLVR